MAALALLVGCAGSPVVEPAGTAALSPDQGATQLVQSTDTPPSGVRAPVETASTVSPPSGAFAPIELAGTGSGTTVPITSTTRVNRIVLTHDGSSRFVVLARYPNGSSEFLLNAQGRYRGSRVMLSSRAHFEIEADGPWTLRIEAVGVDEAVGQRYEGTGDSISNWFTPPASGNVTYAYSHTGQRNFYVQIHCVAGNRDHIFFIDAVGTVERSAVAEFDQGPCLWDVQADGAWELRLAP